MSRTDLISDGLTMLRNASLIKRESVVIPYSNVLLKICEILKREGYLENFRKTEEKKKPSIKLYLKYRNKKNAFSVIKRISRPARRMYVKKNQVPSVLRGKGLALISTPQGLLTDEEARKAGLGGEVLLYVW